MPKVILQGYIIVPDSSLEKVEEELAKHIELTRKESGNLIFEVTTDVKNHNRFTVYEEFVSQDAFDSHQQRVKGSRWGEVTTDVERHYEITTVG